MIAIPQCALPYERMTDARSASELFAANNLPAPRWLAEWQARLDGLCGAYSAQHPDAQLFEITQSAVIFVWDMAAERVVVVYGLSTAQRRRVMRAACADSQIQTRAWMQSIRAAPEPTEVTSSLTRLAVRWI
jgi:hypothetical protein